ncbi:hypothetical protein GCM10011608_55760 [Micromonospora sonchi]|uniref:Uncharacterized protein n=1 Tax=Micromonospora sonchi TaxID=1763543 RepID=A0A917U7K8_9ACTN|nr:hypothetical protein GCM10011608_55760 [Micromonospora sonchi]
MLCPVSTQFVVMVLAAISRQAPKPGPASMTTCQVGGASSGAKPMGWILRHCESSGDPRTGRPLQAIPLWQNVGRHDEVLFLPA